MLSFRQAKLSWRAAAARREIAGRRITPRAHGLDRPLIVSLTSYGARFPTLADTLRSLLRQTVRADRTILWLSEADHAALPPDIEALRDEGLEVGISPNYRSFTKIVPTLLAHPGSYVVTADDDLPYWADWLETLVQGMAQGGAASVAHRAHRIRLGAGGPLPYRDWDWAIHAPETGPLVFPTGVLGVIYDTAQLHPDAARPELFTRLCPSADDIWLWWMTRLTGGQARKTGAKKHRILEWPGSQGQNLRTGNLTGTQNDEALAAMIAHYGFPG